MPVLPINRGDFIFPQNNLLFAIGFFLQVPVLLALWPFPDTTPLTFIFVASILAAAGASHLWVAWAKQWGAAVGVALGYIVMLGYRAEWATREQFCVAVQ